MDFWRYFQWNKQIFKILKGSWVIPKNVRKNAKQALEETLWFRNQWRVLIRSLKLQFKTCNRIVLKIQICIFWTDWEIPRQTALRSGRFITDIDYMVENKLFCFIDHIEKLNSFLDIALFESPIWLWKEALMRACSASLRVACNHEMMKKSDQVRLPNNLVAHFRYTKSPNNLGKQLQTKNGKYIFNSIISKWQLLY